MDMELWGRLGLGVTGFSVIGLWGPSEGNGAPRREQKEKKHYQHDLDQKAKSEYWVLPLISSVALAS